MDLIKALWRGDVALVKTYWLFGVVAGIIFNIVFAYIEHQSALYSTVLGGLFVLALVVFVFAYSIFICFAIWRSANKYRGLQRYAILAKVAVILSVVALINAVLEIFGRVPADGGYGTCGVSAISPRVGAWDSVSVVRCRRSMSLLP